jgi:ABC-2 type transport system permease protein
VSAGAGLTYTRFELRRTVRNRRYFLLALVFPVVLYFLIAGPNQDVHNLGGSGISAPLYFMVGLISFGTMSAMLSGGARIATERSVGWNRQLRLTPLTPRDYIRAKVVSAYLVAGMTIVLLYICGASLGVSIPAGRWLEMTGLILVGLIPFAALGIAGGHVLTADSIGPALGGTVALLAFLGGTWFPITNGALHGIAQALPSYWLTQASHVALGGAAWGVTGWLVMAGWTVVLGGLALLAYRRDTKRV